METIAAGRAIAHLDLDSFYVGVERLKNPALRGKAMAVGGSSGLGGHTEKRWPAQPALSCPNGEAVFFPETLRRSAGVRGVITSCSYEARKFGVHSAMPTHRALQLCPDLILVKGSMEDYATYSRLVTAIIASEVPLFEKSSIDEFYIDMTGMDRFFGCWEHLVALRARIMRETGLDISMALGTSKLISKVATNEVKPLGLIRVAPGEEKSYLAPLPIGKIPMLGRQTAETLHSIGIGTVGELAAAPLEVLTRLLGRNGESIWRKANALDDSPVHPYHEAKSLGTEHTFHADTDDPVFLHRELMRMTERIAFDLRSGDWLTGCVTVKIRYHDFQTFTKQSSIPLTASDHLLWQTARALFDALYRPPRAVRLIGVRFTHLLAGGQQMKLFEDSPQKSRLYQAIDGVKKKFGNTLLTHGGCL